MSSEIVLASGERIAVSYAADRVEAILRGAVDGELVCLQRARGNLIVYVNPIHVAAIFARRTS